MRKVIVLIGFDLTEVSGYEPVNNLTDFIKNLWVSVETLEKIKKEDFTEEDIEEGLREGSFVTQRYEHYSAGKMLKFLKAAYKKPVEFHFIYLGKPLTTFITSYIKKFLQDIFSDKYKIFHYLASPSRIPKLDFYTSENRWQNLPHCLNSLGTLPITSSIEQSFEVLKALATCYISQRLPRTYWFKVYSGSYLKMTEELNTLLYSVLQDHPVYILFQQLLDPDWAYAHMEHIAVFIASRLSFRLDEDLCRPIPTKIPHIACIARFQSTSTIDNPHLIYDLLNLSGTSLSEFISSDLEDFLDMEFEGDIMEFVIRTTQELKNRGLFKLEDPDKESIQVLVEFCKFLQEYWSICDTLNDWHQCGNLIAWEHYTDSLDLSKLKGYLSGI